LWVMIFGLGLLTAAKVGSGMNYFLSLRVVESLALGEIWGTVRNVRTRSRGGLAAMLLIATMSLAPGTVLAMRTAWLAQLDARFYKSQEGQRFLVEQQHLFRLAEDPRVRLLSDSGLLQLHQKERAPFVDPFQFRHMVNSGQIEPDSILENLAAESYDFVITTSDLNRIEYDADALGLPAVVARAARVHYVLGGRRLGLFLYTRRSVRPRRAHLNRYGEPGPPYRPAD
jgi:hypothetical protein